MRSPRGSLRARRRVLLLAALGLATHGLGTAPSAKGESSEYQVKAAFIYNAVKFVEWPRAAIGGGAEPFVVAVLGTSHISDIEAALEDRSWRGRPIAVRGYARAKDVRPCHVLFISSDGIDEGRAALRAVRGQPILTISEADDVDTVIAMGITDARLSFSVNLDSADANGLQISASLLGLAKTVQSTRLKRSAP